MIPGVLGIDPTGVMGWVHGRLVSKSWAALLMSMCTGTIGWLGVCRDVTSVFELPYQAIRAPSPALYEPSEQNSNKIFIFGIPSYKSPLQKLFYKNRVSRKPAA